MHIRRKIGIRIAGAAAGIANGLFGTGGGMLLVPLLTRLAKISDEQIFPCSVSIILPICIVSLVFQATQTPLPLAEAWPYLLGSIPGGVLAGLLGRRIPVLWLHRILGLLILWGGVRYLC